MKDQSNPTYVKKKNSHLRFSKYSTLILLYLLFIGDRHGYPEKLNRRSGGAIAFAFIALFYNVLSPT